MVLLSLQLALPCDLCAAHSPSMSGHVSAHLLAIACFYIPHSPLVRIVTYWSILDPSRRVPETKAVSTFLQALPHVGGS